MEMIVSSWFPLNIIFLSTCGSNYLEIWVSKLHGYLLHYYYVSFHVTSCQTIPVLIELNDTFSFSPKSLR